MLFAEMRVWGFERPVLIHNAARQDIPLGGIVLLLIATFGWIDRGCNRNLYAVT
jgi:hypothetical protein